MLTGSWLPVTAAEATGAGTGCGSLHWQGKPLVDVQTAVNLIRSTTTENGLSVACMLDKNVYETGIKVTDESIDAIDIEYIGPHHGWSYINKRL